MEHIKRLLESIGETPDEVAASLRAAPVQGLRDRTSSMDPIVRYINRNLDVGGKLEVGAGGSVLRLLLDGKPREVPLPLPVQVFLDGFHRGLYPDLEEPTGTWAGLQTYVNRLQGVRRGSRKEPSKTAKNRVIRGAGRGR